MIILNKDSKLVKILEVGENDILIEYMDKEYEVNLHEDDKEPIYKLITLNSTYTTIYNFETGRFLVDVKYRDSNELEELKNFLNEMSE